MMAEVSIGCSMWKAKGRCVYDVSLAATLRVKRPGVNGSRSFRGVRRARPAIKHADETVAA